MNGPRCLLIACTSSPPLRDLLRGTAGSLRLDLREVTCADEILDLPGLSPLAIAVVEGRGVSDSLLRSIERLTSSMRLWLAVVTTDEPLGSDPPRAMAAGAINCVSLSTAMQAIPYLIRIILERTSPGCVVTSERLPIGGNVVLMIPGHILTDGECESALPPITGRLLECLALHPDSVVSLNDLKRYGWGASAGVTDHAVSQQLSRLREALGAFGIEDRVRCLRGRGYLLAPIVRK